MDYYRDGQSIYDTEEYNSYFLAGKAPKDFKTIKQKAIENAVSPVYTGVFFNQNEVLSTFEPKHPNVFGDHVTTPFRPGNVNIDVGKVKSAKVIGRLTTDKVDVLILDNVDTDNKTAHITLAVADGVKPYESNNEIEKYKDQIEYFTEPISLKGKYGYFSQDEKVITSKRDYNKEVKANYASSLVNTVESYFEKETGRRTPPAVLWTKFTLRNNVELSETPILGAGMIGEAMAGWGTDPAVVEEFVDWIVQKGKDPYKFTSEMKPMLINTLEQDGWFTKESEFYMPPHHQAGYLIYNGDLIEDFVGTQEQPDLASIAHLVTKEELDLIHTKWHESREEVNKIVEEKLLPTEEGKKYVDLREQQNQHLDATFTEKINDFVRIARTEHLTAIQYNGLKRRAPLLLLERTKRSYDATLKQIDKLLSDKDVIANPDAMKVLFELRGELQTLKSPDQTKAVVDTAIAKYNRMWKYAMMDSFDKSLTFLTARIPAHGKPSATAGKIKNFIYSTRNTIYGPAEMLTIAGSDHDGDKQNNMTWDVDNLGRIIDWKQYIDKDTGLVDLDVAMNKLDLETDAIVKDLIDSGLDPNTAQQRGDDYKKSRLEAMHRAMENLIVDILINVAKDPKNALEATTATSMRKLGIIKDYLDSFNFSETDYKKFGIEKGGGMNAELLEAILKRQYALPFVPSTKFLYEKVNAEGKQGVGIFASALKAYYASYFAWLTNGSVKNYGQTIDKMVRDGKVDLLQDDIESMHARALNSLNAAQIEEEKYIKFKNKFFSEPKYKAVGVEENAFHFVWKDPATGLFQIKTDIFSLANSKQFMPDVGGVKARLRSRVAKKVFSDVMVYQHAGDAEAEATAIIKHMTSLEAYNSMMMEDQAWEDLAELLNAATDNAKELILSKIGANNNTSSLIATMVMLGIDLKSALLVLNDPIIKDILSDLENKYGSLTKAKPDVILSMRSLLKQAAKKYRPRDTMSDSELEKNVRTEAEKRKAAGQEINEAQIQAIIKKQKALRDVYNPAEQLLWYNDMANEITQLSGDLSINQGLPNSELDVLNYILGLEGSFALRGANTLDTKVTMDDFIKNKSGARKEIMDAYNDKIKVAFNIPYIMAKNDHMFTYIDSLYETNNVLKGISYTVRLIYEDLAETLPDLKGKLENSELKQFIDLLMAVSVDQYYRNNKKVFTFDGVTYDLSNYDDRVKFVKDFPNILKAEMAKDSKLAANQVLGKIGNIRTETDPATGISYTYLSGIDTSVLEDGKIQILKNKLATLKETHPIIHDALFNYSLNVDKAGLGKNSIAALFEGEDYLTFSQSLNEMERTGSVEERFKNIPLAVKRLLMPSLLEEYCTQEGAKNDALKKIYDGDEDSLSADEMDAVIEQSEGDQDGYFSEHEDFYEEDFIGTSNYDQMIQERSQRWDVTNMNQLKLDNPGDYPDIFRSKTNGMIYAWFEPKDTYVPITRVDSPAIINSDINEATDAIRDMRKFGYNWGFEVNVPGTSEKGRVLYLYDDFNDQYAVLRENGKIEYFTKDALRTVNPQIFFAKNAIIVNKAKYRVTENLQFYKHKKTGDLFTAANKNTELIQIETTDDQIIQEYDQVMNVTKEAVEQVFKGKQLVNVDYGKVMSMFPDLVTELQLVAYMTENKGDVKPESLFGVRKAIIDNNGKEVSQPILKLREALESLPSTTKYKLLRATRDDRISILQGLSETLGLFSDTNLKRDYTANVRDKNDLNRLTDNYNGKKLTKSDKEILTKDSLVTDMSVRDFLDITKKIGITPKRYLQLTGKDVLVYKNNVFVSDKVNITTVDVKEQKKELILPPSERRKALKEVSPEVIRRLGTFLNDRFKGTTVKVLSTAEIKELYGNKFSESAAFVYGGTIIMNSDVADLGTMLHEMGHLYLAEIKEVAPDEYERLMELAKQDPLMKEMVTIYPELSETDVAEEVFVELLARRNGDSMEDQFTDELEGDDGSFLGKVKRFFKNIFSSFFGISEDKIDADFRLSDSLYDVIDKVGTDIIFNKNSMLKGILAEHKTIMKNRIGPDAKMSRAEAIRFLTEKGYIRKVC